MDLSAYEDELSCVDQVRLRGSDSALSGLGRVCKTVGTKRSTSWCRQRLASVRQSWRLGTNHES